MVPPPAYDAATIMRNLNDRGVLVSFGNSGNMTAIGFVYAENAANNAEHPAERVETWHFATANNDGHAHIEPVIYRHKHDEHLMFVPCSSSTDFMMSVSVEVVHDFESGWSASLHDISMVIEILRRNVALRDQLSHIGFRCASFYKGDIAYINGLTQRSDLNGATCVVSSGKQDDRIPCVVGNKVVRVRHGNLFRHQNT